ncbi:MAG: hypothetical protein KF802_12270 [Bdellovibrionaceae bacterium]|nr:hypothetical protein [Pseudobdellovibrionaceae bacterium]MBX3035229.1 hypothetical protein [Pseudobdellovibrionaceae bacterium]
MKITSLLLSVSALTGLSACAPEATDMYHSPRITEYQAPQQPELPKDTILNIKPEKKPTFENPKPKWITIDGGGRQFDFNPNIDILFVVDDSDSMKSAQENLSNNINSFVAGLQKNRMINYNIGVISVWDSTDRYYKANSGKSDSYQIGELRRIKDEKNQYLKARFVTRFKNNEKILASTLKIGVTPYEQGGPETEEVFSPLSAALKKGGRGAVNEGFFREDAALVVVVVTDADDASASISAEQMAQELFDFKGGRKDRVSVYGVLVSQADADEKKDWGLRVHPRYHPECFDTVKGQPKNNGKCRNGFGPTNLENFIVLANPSSGSTQEIRQKHIKSLTKKSFGSDLSKIGSDITMKALEKEIYLDQRPLFNDKGVMIEVRYGTPEALAQGKGQLIPQKRVGGWHYDPENNSVRLAGSVVYEYVEGARFSLRMAVPSVVLPK